MRTVTKKELVNRIAEKTGQTKVVAKEIIQAFLDAIIDELAEGNRLEFREFGVFESKERAARRAQNPRTLERVEVPAKRIVKFKVGRLMRKRVSGDDEDDLPEPHDDDSDGTGARAPRRASAARPATDGSGKPAATGKSADATSDRSPGGAVESGGSPGSS
ncbi:MAG: integration host factor subunit beta [Planctomycetes bacterium]|nr:integration host factor subunit beta [Planctomycetota bacterium]